MMRKLKEDQLIKFNQDIVLMNKKIAIEKE